MSVNTKIRLAILASSVALAAAAPAAFAMVGGTFSSSETTKTDTTSGNNTEQVAPEKLVPVGAVPDTGTSSYRPQGGTPDATPGHETKKVKHMKHMKHKKTAPIDPDASAIQQQPEMPK
jgi:hypothetical protein